MSPADIAAQALGVSSARIRSVESIKHGLTNDSWLVRSIDDAVVVRISNPNSQALQIDRLSEATVLAAVAAAGIGPEVLVCRPAERLLVTRYLGCTWTDEMANRDANVRRVALLLRHLHSLPVPAGVRRIDLVAVVEGYAHDLHARGVSHSKAAVEMRRRAAQIARSLTSDAPRLCHNDVHALNLVDNGELRLIDWEYAGAGDRCFDLASICVYQQYSKAQRERLLEAYGGEAQVSWNRLELACWLFDYIRELWFAVRSLAPR